MSQSDIVEVIIMANPSRSMGNYKRFCTDKAEAVDKFLNDVKDRPLTPHEVLKLKKLRDDLENQFGRAHAKWEDLIAADEFPDDNVYAKCEKDYNDSKVLADKHLKAADNALKIAPAVESAPSVAPTGQITTKIDELLKPKELLLTAMTLEEADEWFKSRALLNKSIEAKLSSAAGCSRHYPDHWNKRQ